MRIDHKPADVCLLQHLLDALDVTTFRQPDALRIAPETLPIRVAGNEDLRPDRFGIGVHQGQKTMRRRAGDYFQKTTLLQTRKLLNEITIPALEELPALDEMGMITPGLLVNERIGDGAMHLLLSEADEPFDVPDVTRLEQRIAQHGAQSRSQRQREAKSQPVGFHRLKNFQQRDVSLRDGLVKPDFLQKINLFGMPDERQMRMQDESELSLTLVVHTGRYL